MLPARVPWNGFPEVIVHSSICKLKCLPTYFADFGAKQGDHQDPHQPASRRWAVIELSNLTCSTDSTGKILSRLQAQRIL